jgi:hypothetical protein
MASTLSMVCLLWGQQQQQPPPQPCDDPATFSPPHQNPNHNDTAPFARVWTQITFSVEFDASIIPHAIRHYQGLGLHPHQFLVVLHHKRPDAPELQETVHMLRQDYSVRHVHTWSGNFTSDANNQQRQKQRRNVGIDDCDWILKFDADEFLRTPDVRSLLSALGTQGFDAIRASWMDRVASHGRLPNISDTPFLPQQFPMACANFSANAGNATTHKVVAFRGYLKEKRAGHSLAKGLKSCMYPVQLILDHYKWSWPVVQKLRVRLEHYRQLETTYWWTESAAFLDHMDAHGDRIDVDDPQFQCRNVVDDGDNAVPPLIHSFASVRDGVAEAEPCRSAVRRCPNRLV